MDKNIKSNESGQMVIEAILILVFLLGGSFFVAKQFKSNELFASVISKPWKSIAGMLENGYWESPSASRSRHPGHRNRHISVKGKGI